MKLAEALLLRTDMQKKLSSLRQRIAKNALLQEGQEPNEQPEELIKQSFEVLDQLGRLTTVVNSANLEHTLPDGRTMTAALAERDMLREKHAVLQTGISATQQEPDRYSARQIKWIPALCVADLQRQSDDLSKQIRELNAKIQATNWAIEIDYT